MGNCTVVIKKRTGLAPTGAMRVVDISLSTSYATGGDTVPIASLDLDTIDALVLVGTAGGYMMDVVHGANVGIAPKIRLYEDKATAGASPGLEAAAGSNESAVTVRALAIGDNPHV